MEEDGTDAYPSRNPGWPNEARVFMLRTAASIVTASRYAPITRPTISSANGATAAVHRAIIFLSGQYFSEKCVWARIFRISRAHAGGTGKRSARRNRKCCNLARTAGGAAAPPARVLLHLGQIQVLRQKPFATARRATSKSNRIASASGSLCSLSIVVSRFAGAINEFSCSIASGAAGFAAAECASNSGSEGTSRFAISVSGGKTQARPPAHRRGLFRQVASQRCIPLRGIMCIFIRAQYQRRFGTISQPSSRL